MNTLAFLAFALAASNAAAPAHPPCPGEVVLGVDVSNSISSAQLAAWRPVAQQRVDTLCPDDHFAVFTIDGYTLSRTPLFEGTVPQRPTSGTMEDLMVYRTALLQFRAGVTAAFDKAFSGTAKASATDIFSLFDRVSPRPHREFLLFTDGLHSTKDLDLETRPLRAAAFGAIIRDLASLHRWDSGKLAGASVRFLLPSPSTNGPPRGPNDQRVLNDFYDALVRALGGHLQLFDSYIH